MEYKGLSLLGHGNDAWLKAFVTKHGRAPRVLHIGNIANNAYNNAKLLNQAGLDCDVICYDYYHSMACPEWEDADFDGQLDDHGHPDWSAHDLRGFRRPAWFAQGPLWLCIDYLVARRRGAAVMASWHWMRLAQFNKTERGSPGRKSLLFAHRLATAVRHRTRALLRLRPRSAFKALAVRYFGLLVGAPVGAVLALAAMPVWALASAADRQRQRHTGEAGALEQFSRRCAELLKRWPVEFPDRGDFLAAEDLHHYNVVAAGWATLLPHYDFVIGYSTDPIHPLLAGRPYFAFEHGTIREIPYQPTLQGRCAALSYRLAHHVFVTNFDCRHSADRLAPGRYTLINHPYDEDHGLQVGGWEEMRESLMRELRCDFLCFFPTRHDWVPGTGYADKANDVFMRAIGELKSAGIRVGVVCCTWGANVEHSRRLLADLGVADQFKWQPPMAMTKFERTARACDLVVDQFKLGSFGGILFKAMAVGAPILTYLDENKLAEQYSEMPPVVNCATTAEVVASVAMLRGDRSRLASLQAASRQWVEKNHGKRETVERQVSQFRLLATAET